MVSEAPRLLWSLILNPSKSISRFCSPTYSPGATITIFSLPVTFAALIPALMERLAVASVKPSPESSVREASTYTIRVTTAGLYPLASSSASGIPSPSASPSEAIAMMQSNEKNVTRSNRIQFKRFMISLPYSDEFHRVNYLFIFWIYAGK